MDRLGLFFLKRPGLLSLMVVLALVLLPVALWLDLKTLSDQNLTRQATSLSTIMTNVRAYYARNVVGRISGHEGQARAMHDYLSQPGAIPIPATLSLELGEAIGSAEGDVEYRFLSDYAFVNRPPHTLTAFDIEALATFRAGAVPDQMLVNSTGNLWDRRITLATPVVMSGACVSCHNTHPESPKTDWKVGDVRGLQSVTVHQPVALNLWSFKYLLVYLALAGGIGMTFALLQFRLAGSFGRLNDELAANNKFLADISLKISKYLSPQVYRSIFSGERDSSISTERKKLTVFFSDIKDFTSTTEMLQPEDLTNLLNEYFSEMSKIAEAHGATIDKFIGDAIVAFFGDPETRGTTEDARACMRMALDMQKRLGDLELIWRSKGLEHPFRARMGINTGYCNVGNFGSDARMDYTIIGAEANLAARLESIAEPGGIVISYETYAHVRDIVSARPLDPVTFKGIARQVVPYRVDVSESESPVTPALQETENGTRLTVDLARLDDHTRRAVRDAVRAALIARRID